MCWDKRWGVSRHQIVKIFVTVSRNLQFINEGNGEYLSADYLGAVSRNPRPICLYHILPTFTYATYFSANSCNISDTQHYTKAALAMWIMACTWYTSAEPKGSPWGSPHSPISSLPHSSESLLQIRGPGTEVENLVLSKKTELIEIIWLYAYLTSFTFYFSIRETKSKVEYIGRRVRKFAVLVCREDNWVLCEEVLSGVAMTTCKEVCNGVSPWNILYEWKSAKVHPG